MTTREERDARRAAALRENLRKRKTQARALDADGAAPAAPAAPPLPGETGAGPSG